MTLLLGNQAETWPTERARQRWARIVSATLYSTWKKANPREAVLVEGYWTLAPAERPTVQTAYGKHLLEHCDDLRALAAHGVVS